MCIIVDHLMSGTVGHLFSEKSLLISVFGTVGPSFVYNLLISVFRRSVLYLFSENNLLISVLRTVGHYLVKTIFLFRTVGP